MSIAPAIPRTLTPALCGLQPSYQWTGYTPAHFYLWYLEGLSDLQPFVVGHRGVRQLKRWKITAKYKFCLDQLEQGDSLTHTFILPQRPNGTQVYLAWSDHCSARLSSTAGPPVPYTYVDCPPNIDFITQTGTAPFSFTTARLVQNWVRLDGNPAMHLGPQYVQAQHAGTYRISEYISVTSGSMPTTVTWHVYAGSLVTPVHNVIQVFGSDHETINMQFSIDVVLALGDLIYTSMEADTTFPVVSTYNVTDELPFQSVQRIA